MTPRFAIVLPAVFLLASTVGGCGVSPEFRDDPAYADSEGESVAALPGDPALVGRFEGVGIQSNGPTWSVSVAFTDPAIGTCAIVRFPEDECTGYWDCTDVDGDRIEAVERITRGKDKCLDGVRIRARLLPGGQTLAFVGEAKGIKAVGKLRRVE